MTTTLDRAFVDFSGKAKAAKPDPVKKIDRLTVITDGGRRDSGLHPRERRDCTVRATALATGRPYAEVHADFKAAGRQDGKPFNWCLGWAIRTGSGFKRNDEILQAGNRRLVNVLDRIPKTGRWIVQTKRHVFAFIEGNIYDLGYNRPFCRVVSVWQYDGQTGSACKNVVRPEDVQEAAR